MVVYPCLFSPFLLAVALAPSLATPSSLRLAPTENFSESDNSYSPFW